MFDKKINYKKEQKMCYYQMLEALDASISSNESSSRTYSSDDESSNENSNSFKTITEKEEVLEESCKKSSIKEVKEIFGFKN